MSSPEEPPRPTIDEVLQRLTEFEEKIRMLEHRVYDLESENIRLRKANMDPRNTARFAGPGASTGIRTSSSAREASHSSNRNTADGVPVVNVDVDGSFIRRAAQQTTGSEPDNSSSDGSSPGNVHSAAGQDLPWAAQTPPPTHDRAQAPQMHPLDDNVRLVGMVGRRNNVPIYECGICRTGQIIGDEPAAQHIAGAQHQRSAAFLRGNRGGQQVPGQDVPQSAQPPPSTHDHAQDQPMHPMDRNLRLVGMTGRRNNVPIYECGICRTGQIVGDEPAAQHIAGAQHQRSAAFLRRNGEGQQVPGQDLPGEPQPPPSTHDRAQVPPMHPMDRNVRLAGMTGRRNNVPIYDCGICRTAQFVGDEPAAQHIAGALHQRSAAFLRGNREGF